MNGRISRRIRRIAKIIYPNGHSNTIKSKVKILKYEYKLKPYHLRDKARYFVDTSHKAQEVLYYSYIT